MKMLMRWLIKWLKSKKGIALRELAWWIIAVAVLLIIVIGISILFKTDQGAITAIKEIFRFGS